MPNILQGLREYYESGEVKSRNSAYIITHHVIRQLSYQKKAH